MAQYAVIDAINTPPTAAQGDPVSIAIQVRNLADYGFYVSVAGDVDGVAVSFTPDYAGVDPGAVFTFYGSFVMPGKSVTITVTSWWWGSDNAWHQDDVKTAVVNLAALSPQVSEFQIADFSRV